MTPVISWAQAIGNHQLAKQLYEQAASEDDVLLVWQTQLDRRLALGG